MGTIFIVPRVVHLASQVLPGAGAFTSQAYSAIPILTKRVTFWISYTGASATGAPAFRVEYQNASDTDHRTLILDQSSLVIAQPEADVDVIQETLDGPVPGVAISKYVLPVLVPSLSTGIRLLAAELGDTGNPGTIFVALTGEGEK